MKKEVVLTLGMKTQDSLAESKPFNSISVTAGLGTRLKVSRAERIDRTVWGSRAMRRSVEEGERRRLSGQVDR
jgi:hypothetical protein